MRVAWCFPTSSIVCRSPSTADLARALAFAATIRVLFACLVWIEADADPAMRTITIADRADVHAGACDGDVSA